MNIKTKLNLYTGIVVPCYIEFERINLSEFSEFFSLNKSTFICFVNDGSSDGTKSILENFVKKNCDRCQLIDLPYNQGKAEAVRQGIITLLKTPIFKFVGYWDADLATPLITIQEFTKKMRSNSKLVIICGSRILRLGSSIHRSIFRHYLGRLFATIASNILRIPVYDTQCGAKLFRTKHAELIFSEKFLSRWYFDIELFARSIEIMGRRETILSVYEIPLSQWHDQGESKISWVNIIYTPIELLRIYYNYRNRMLDCK